MTPKFWEWFDEVPTADQIVLLRKIADSKEVILHFTGQTYYDDATIGAGDKRAISDMLAAYEMISEG
ncbi:hypothetical protein C5F48_16170 [Cereibacter changlensis JA139]|uniref:Uncharacterized protein n=3 Tax=Cereibacter changlensis TaxID=402884 RepID=A0A2T4JS50_9RHOB|nr:hypothetical protein [Cereibacter changlensis]PTE20706.1 hypothetical protein C5F48_16170 [Cereibacter changlensis JA139]PZX49021.1 hypothetical protein LX76_04062 [Cereibacter changlensis]